MGSRGFWHELKRRHVYRVAAAYVVIGWLLIQVATQIFPVFHLPDWTEQAVVLAILIGFPIALVLAWAFDATPHGIVATGPATDGAATDMPPRRRSRRAGIAVGLIGVLIALIAGGAYRHFGRTGSRATSVKAAANAHSTSSPDGVKRNPGSTVPDSAAGAAASGLRVPSAQPIPAKSIAVLPFENLSDDKGNAYFADGMQDLILTKLADIGDLKVISRTSTAKYASHPNDLKTIGQQLGVATILEGSVQKAGHQVLINVQLIDAKTDSHIWAQSYQRTLDNLFGVEGEVADRVAKALNAKLTPAEAAEVAKAGTHDPAALDAQLRANYYLSDANRTSDETELARSVSLYKQAIAADPNYAEAYTGLALAYQKLGGHDREQEAAVRRALALDPDNARAHTEYAFALSNKGKFDAAIAEARKAVALPSHSDSDIDGLGFVLLFAGRMDEAAKAFERAVKGDPQINFSRKWMAYAMAACRRYADARESLRYVVARDPDNVSAVSMLAQIERLGFGDLGAARKALQSTATPAASSAPLSEAWYELDFNARDYPAALAVLAKAPAATFTPSEFFNHEPRALYEARTYRAQGDGDKAQSAFAAARDQIEAKLKATPNDASLHADLAQALAGLGDSTGAVKEAKRAVALQRFRHRAITEPGLLVNLANVEAHTGRADDAIELLGRLLSMPAGMDMSVEDLRINPEWDPIRTDPHFQMLLKKYAEPQPPQPPVLRRQRLLPAGAGGSE